MEHKHLPFAAFAEQCKHLHLKHDAVCKVKHVFNCIKSGNKILDYCLDAKFKLCLNLIHAILNSN